jgi:hypothetical protein
MGTSHPFVQSILRPGGSIATLGIVPDGPSPAYRLPWSWVDQNGFQAGMTTGKHPDGDRYEKCYPAEMAA